MKTSVSLFYFILFHSSKPAPSERHGTEIKRRKHLPPISFFIGHAGASLFFIFRSPSYYRAQSSWLLLSYSFHIQHGLVLMRSLRPYYF